tara:strand:+ start:375 stop:584 length:210 start_codon:yes stop_codon:yes gene_type:complete
MEVIKQLLLVIVLLNVDGQYTSSATPVVECPEAASFSEAMEAGRRSGQFKGWIAHCTAGQFLVTEDTPA